jgi:hypothetical protein
MFEITGIGLAKALRCVAVLTLGTKVRHRDRLVAVRALRSGSLDPFMAVLTPQLGVPADQQIGVGESRIWVHQELVAGQTILIGVGHVIGYDPRRADNARLVAEEAVGESARLARGRRPGVGNGRLRQRYGGPGNKGEYADGDGDWEQGQAMVRHAGAPWFHRRFTSSEGGTCRMAILRHFLYPDLPRAWI